MHNYMIKHTLVGPFPQGRVVSTQQLKETNADISRLLELNAIEAVEDSQTETPVPIGPENPTGNLSKNPPASGNPPTTGMREVIRYDQQKVEELRSLAIERQIEGAEGMRKADLVTALEDYDRNPPATSLSGNEGDDDDDDDDDDEEV